MNTATAFTPAFWENLATISADADLSRRLMNYVTRLVKPKADPTAMTREEFYAKIERAEADFAKGNTYAMLPGESFSEFRKRIGR